MTGGGLYILVAYGSQNMILSGNPDFTYFYFVLKKHSHFSFESATLQMNGPQELSFNQPIQLRAKIQRIGDLLSDLYFTFTLPDIYSKYVRGRGSQYEFQWVRYIGAQIIQDASFYVGGSLIQQIDSDYIIASALTDQDETQYNKWQRLVGDVAELYDPANGQYSGEVGNPISRTPGLYPNVYNDIDIDEPQNNFPSIPGRDITLPLGFWFSQSSHLALPLIALQYHECEVQLTLRPIQDLYTVLDSSGYRVRPGNSIYPTVTPIQLQKGNVTYTVNSDTDILLNQFLTDSGHAVPTISTWPLNARLQATYVYLTEDERKTFATKSLSYLVRQVTRYSFQNISSRQYFELYTHNPVPRLIIIPRRSDAIPNRNDWTNYTNWWKYPSAPFISNSMIKLAGELGTSGQLSTGIQQDIIRQMRILCDGNEIQEIKSAQYFKDISSWKYATGIFPPGLAIYSFALHSSNWMKPSGTLNTSRVKMFQIDIDMWPLPADTNYLIDYVIYVESLNFFVVEGGMGGMKYAI